MTSAVPTSLLIHTVTWVVPATSTDARNNVARNYTSPASSTSISGRMEQNKGTEAVEDGRDSTDRRWTLFTNQDGISAFDRIVFGSLTFEVDGPPAPTYGGAAFHHAEVALKLIAG